MHGFARIHSRGLHRSSVGDVMQTPLMANTAHSPAAAALQTSDEAGHGR
jgi:hypothetical protein